MVSIHASARDATLKSAPAFVIVPGFNPRVREGRDDRLLHPLDMPPVSIHASARDATGSPCFLSPMERFQSTRPRGTRQDGETYGISI